jgi:UV DNA damage endonuclease
MAHMKKAEWRRAGNIAEIGRSTEKGPANRRKSSVDSNQVRLGLCCQFIEQPIRFRTTTAASLMRLSAAERRLKLSRICLSNTESLSAALRFCVEHGIGCFRINSQILPVKTHPIVGYTLNQLPAGKAIITAFRSCRTYVEQQNLRVVFHPDQFVVLNSPREDVVKMSIKELEYQAEVAEWVGADVINVHGGGAYNDKTSALQRLARNLDLLSDATRSRLTIENDDHLYTPKDLLPLCRATGLPLVYDVHHHRCLQDGWRIEQATELALATWRREPLFHLSSPLGGWDGPKPQRHHDYVNVSDFPDCWRELRITVEVEAKAKELAVLRLRDELFRPVAA